MKDTSSKQILLPLQGLRALAFIGIFLSHCNVGILSSSGLGDWGVSVFLILSGFLMMINYFHSDKLTNCSLKGNLKFSLKKISKIYPLHIVMMIAALPFEIRAILTNHGGVLHSCIVLLLKVFLNITVTQSFVPYSSIYYSLNSVSWYLSVCLLTYFCFPWILRYFKKKMNFRKANLLIPTLLVLQIVLCWLSSKMDLAISDGFTEWFVYNFPIMRMIDFLFGIALGYVYLQHRDNDEQSNKKLWILNQKGAEDVALLLDLAALVVMLIVYSLTNPGGDLFSHSELWWRYSCLFTLLNGVMIYLLAMDNGVLSRVLSTKGIVFIGEISSTAFLIHQMIIRYLNTFIKYIDTDALLVSKVLIVCAPLLLTVVVCEIWNKLYQKIKLIIQTKRSSWK